MARLSAFVVFSFNGFELDCDGTSSTCTPLPFSARFKRNFCDFQNAELTREMYHSIVTLETCNQSNYFYMPTQKEFDKLFW